MDKSLFHLINEQWTHPALDLFMATIGNVDIWMPLIVAARALCVDLRRIQGARFHFLYRASPFS